MMSPENLSTNEQISALVDGQLSGEAVTLTVQTLAQDAQARANWHAYHLVGDVLRSEELSWGCAKDSDFLSRLRSRLQDESTPGLSVVAIDSVAAYAGNQRASDLNGHEKEATNDPSLRWKWVAGLASLALATVLGWSLVGGVGTPFSPAQLAQLQPSAMPSHTAAAQDESAQTMVRDPRLDQLLQAHQQFGGASALQMPSGFLRNATCDRPAR